LLPRIRNLSVLKTFVAEHFYLLLDHQIIEVLKRAKRHWHIAGYNRRSNESFKTIILARAETLIGGLAASPPAPNHDVPIDRGLADKFDLPLKIYYYLLSATVDL